MSKVKPTVKGERLAALHAPHQENVAILVVSWDGYQDVWQPFFHCFFKYWPDCPYPVFLGSNSLSYPHSRVSPILIGPDTDYSSNLIAMLEYVKQDWIMFWIDDVLLSGTVDTAKVRSMVNQARHRKAGYLRLNIIPYSITSLTLPLDRGQQIIKVPKGLEYRVGMGLCLWNKNTLLKVLRPGETAWEIERQVTIRSFGLDEEFFSVPKGFIAEPLFPWIHGVLKGVWTWESVRFLRQEGLQESLGERPQQSYWDYIYLKIYRLIRYNVYRLLLRLGLR